MNKCVLFFFKEKTLNLANCPPPPPKKSSVSHNLSQGTTMSNYSFLVTNCILEVPEQGYTPFRGRERH